MVETSVKLNGFGTVYTCDFSFPPEIELIKNSFETLKRKAKEPYILNTYRPLEYLECYELYNNTHISGINILEFLTDDKSDRTFSDKIFSISTEDTEWGVWRNKDLAYEVYKKVTLNPESVNKIIEEADRCLNEIEKVGQKIDEEIRREEKEKEEEKKKLLQDVIWNKHIYGIQDEGGRTKKILHTFVIGNEKFKFYERCVFDFGRVINTEDDKLVIGGDDGEHYSAMSFDDQEGWHPTRTLNENETRCVKIIQKYGYFSDAGIRM